MNGNCFFRNAVPGVLIIAVSVTVCFGQHYWKRDYGPGFIFHMAQSSEDDFELLGQSGNDARLIEINSDGATLSTTIYGEPNSIYTSILETPDCFLICAGQRDNKGRLMKITEGGDSVWTKSFDDSDSYFSTTMFTTSDYHFLFAGGTEGKAWLVNIQSDGTVLWNKSYGERPSSFTSIYETEDGDFLLSGSRKNMASLTKIKNDGDTLWTRVYADTTSGFQSILSTPDNYFLLPGYYNGKAWLVKINPDGDTVWTKTYENGYSYLNSVLNTSGGNFIVAGEQSDNVSSKPLVMKITPNGDTIWTQTYMKNSHTITFVASDDGNFLLSGITTDGSMQHCWIMAIIDNQYAYKNQPFTFTIPTSDPGSSLYTPVMAPPDMKLDAGGTLSWSPQTDSVYIEHVEYSRSNSAGQHDTLKFDIFVNAPSAGLKNQFRHHEIDSRGFEIVTNKSSATVTFSLSNNCPFVCIYDVTGKMVHRLVPVIARSGADALPGVTTFSLGTLPSGKYFAKVSNGKNSLVKQFLFVR